MTMTLTERFGRQAPAGTVLFREGDHGREMFVLQAGKVRLTRVVRGDEQLMAEVAAGEFFGEMSILNDKPRVATAVVIEDAQLLVLDPRTFEAMIKANSEIAVRMIKRLAARLDQANQQIENLLLDDPNSRVVHLLLQLPRTPQFEGGFTVQVSREQLADRTHVALDRVDDVMGRLQRSHLVQPAAGGYAIPDANKLADFLEFLGMRQRFGEVE
jgi:CRP/FNR family transcriptional regulator, cyclic AMP receptor protein